MRFIALLSACVVLVLASATVNEPSLADVLKTLKSPQTRNGVGIRALGLDGVLRRFNIARDAVVDYVQLSEKHIAEFTKRYPAEAREMWAGVDGRAVMSEAQLWAVPDDIKRDPARMTSKPKQKHSGLEARACRDHPCDEPEDCFAVNCAECDVIYECIGGPTSCSRFTRCDDTLGGP